jgi:hypothetical protein
MSSGSGICSVLGFVLTSNSEECKERGWQHAKGHPLEYQGQFFDHADLGPVNVGEHVRVELLWDQPNHRFVIRLFRPASGTFAEQVMPYAISDTTPAVSPFRNINANVYPANCVGTRTSSELEVLFDDVLTR